jgi:hypothetical protein
MLINRFYSWYLHAVDLWPHDCKDGYGVLTFEVLGTRLDNDSKKVRANENMVAGQIHFEKCSRS